MPRLYMLTVPGLQVKSDWAAVHDRLLDDFAQVTDVLATTIPETLVIVYEGDDDIDGWLEGVSDGILSRRMSAGNAPRVTAPMQNRQREPSTSWPGSTLIRLNPDLQRLSLARKTAHGVTRRQAEPMHQFNQSPPKTKGIA